MSIPWLIERWLSRPLPASGQPRRGVNAPAKQGPSHPAVNFIRLAVLLLVMLSRSVVLAQDTETDNPTGPSGDFNGEVTTAGAYDPLTGNLKRRVTDLTVPGSNGAYPLVLARTFNSNFFAVGSDVAYFGDGGNWRHNYQWTLSIATYNSNNGQPTSYNVAYPDGSVVTYKPHRVNAPATEYSTFWRGPSGTPDRLEVQDFTHVYLHTADGGMVNFGSATHPYNIVDPNGAITKLDYQANNPNYLQQVTEPGGRWLKFAYVTTSYRGRDLNGNPVSHTWTLLHQVQASTGQTVTYSEVTSGVQDYGNAGATIPYYVLSDVSYDQESLASGSSGNVHATYTYNQAYNQPVLVTATDPHYAGAMVNIRYASGFRSVEEQNLGTSECVSHLDMVVGSDGTTTSTEARGDKSSGTGNTSGVGATLTRTFNYGASNPAIPGDANANPVPCVKKSLLSGVSDFEAYPSYRYYYDASAKDTSGTGFLRATVDARNNVTRYQHEPLTGKVSVVTLPDGRQRTASWRGADDSNAKLPYYLYQTTNERNQTTTYHHAANTGLVQQIDYPDGTHEFYQYQGFGGNGGAFYKVSLYQNKLGGQITYGYDETDGNHGGSGHAGLLTSVTRSYAVGSQTVHERTVFYYDALDRVSQTQDPRGVTDSYHYNARHQVTQITHAADNSTVIYGYDDNGNCTSVQDENGHATRTKYDEYRRVLSVTTPVNAGGIASRVVQRTYERRNNRNAVVGDALSHTAAACSYAVLPSGRGVQRIYTPNGWLSDEYAGQTTASQSVDLSTADPASLAFATCLHERQNLTYDAVGHLLQSTDAQGHTWQQSFDNCDRPWTRTDPLGHVTTTSYYASTSAYAGLPQSLVTPAHDATNESATLTTTYTAYDLMGRRTGWSDPQNRFTSGYDAQGNLAAQTDGAQNASPTAHPATQYAYDQLGRKQRITYGDGTDETWNYDASGNLASHRNRAGNTQTFNPYDQRNRFGGYTWDDGATSSVTGVVYDNAGHLTQIANAAGQLNLSYDDSGAPLTEQQSLAGGAANLVVRYQPDADGNVGSVTYPGGDVATWQRDFLNRLTQTNYSPAGGNGAVGTLASYSYYAGTNWLGQRLTAGGVTTAYGYLDNDRLGVVDQYRGSQNISYRAYGYYPNGQLSWFVKGADGGSSGSALENGAGDAYFYQPNGQLDYVLQEAASPGTSANGQGDSNPASNLPGGARVCDYGYDAAGNRTFDAETGTLRQPTFDNENRDHAFVYDPNGNTTDLPAGAGVGAPVFHYAYDAENRLVSGGPSGQAPLATFAYDALGRLCARTLNGATSRLYYAGGQLVEERDAHNQKVHTFFYGAGGERVCLLAAFYGNAAIYYHYDARGFVTHLTDLAGRVDEQYLYDACGTPYVYDASGTPSRGQGSAVESNRFLWAGDYEWYPEIGLYRCGARFYHPAYARWLQPDPIGQAGGLNLYLYCHNDPINGSDPSGLQMEFIHSPHYAVGTDGNGVDLNQTPNASVFGNPGGNPSGSESNSGGSGNGGGMPNPISTGSVTTNTNDPALGGAARGVGGGGVGEPGFWRGLVPVLANRQAAIDAFETGHPWQGTFYTAMAVSDVFLVKSLVVGFAKGAVLYGGKMVLKEAAAEGGEHIVLGLEKAGLENTATQVGGKTLLNDPNWKASLMDAIANPQTKFTVSLDGLSGSSPYSQVMNAVQRGFGSNPGATNWELNQLYQAGRMSDVTFVQGGQVIVSLFGP